LGADDQASDLVAIGVEEGLDHFVIDLKKRSKLRKQNCRDSRSGLDNLAEIALDQPNGIQNQDNEENCNCNRTTCGKPLTNRDPRRSRKQIEKA